MGNSESRPAITKVWVKNFRSIKHAELALGPLTVLVGPNASGKSNLLDVLAFLGDIAREGLEKAVSNRGGIASVGRRSPSGRILGPEIGLKYTSEQLALEYAFALLAKPGNEYRVKQETARLQLANSDKPPAEVEIRNGSITKPRIGREPELDDDGGHSDSAAKFIGELIGNSGGRDLNLVSPEHSPVTMLLAFLQRTIPPLQDDPGFRLSHGLTVLTHYLARVRLYHIFPKSLRDPQKKADSHPLATGGKNLASVLREMIKGKGRLYSELRTALTVAVPGVTDIRVVPAGSFYVVELRHENGGGSEKSSWFDLSHESDGTIRLLAMLTALFQDPAPPLICLEEPELAIHPGAMAVLADTMEEAALRGQVLVATHSPDLIDRLPIDSIRAVTAESGSTKVGAIAEHQLKSVKENLFSPGELHSMEGLQPATHGE